MKAFCTQRIDGVTYKLKEPYDFSFLSKYGKVFKVFDEQGINVCFGVKDGERRLFVKFAGAKPVCFPMRLRKAMSRSTFMTAASCMIMRETR